MKLALGGIKFGHTSSIFAWNEIFKVLRARRNARSVDELPTDWNKFRNV